MVNYFASTGWLTIYFITSILYLKLVISQPKVYAILMRPFVCAGLKPGQDPMFPFYKTANDSKMFWQENNAQPALQRI